MAHCCKCFCIYTHYNSGPCWVRNAFHVSLLNAARRASETGTSTSTKFVALLLPLHLQPLTVEMGSIRHIVDHAAMDLVHILDVLLNAARRASSYLVIALPRKKKLEFILQSIKIISGTYPRKYITWLIIFCGFGACKRSPQSK